MGIYTKNTHYVNENKMPDNIGNKNVMTKTFTDSFLYNKSSDMYERDILDFIMKGEMIDKNIEAFEDVKYEVKRRQVSQALVKVLASDLIVIMDFPVRMSKAFTVFMAKDIKNDGKNRIFIYNDSIVKNDTGYKLRNPDVFIAHLVDAMNQAIYYTDPKRIVMQADLTKEGACAFAKLFTNVVDYLYKIGSVGTNKAKVLYLCILYYVKCILKKDITDSILHLARDVSGLTDREIDLLDLQFNKDKGFVNIKFFIEQLNKVIGLSRLTVDIFLSKWIYLYGTGTQFALELYPAFASMMTNAYVGCYLNNQKTIEKLIGNHMVSFSQTILRIGNEVV